jgi:penicillin-binding protein 1A
MLIERSKSARARPVTAGAAMAQTTSEHASAAAVRGMPVVQSTGEIELQGHQIRLYGMEGVRGHPVRELRRYLGRREVVCEPIGGGNEHRCRVDDQDLSRVVLFNGGNARQRARRRICAASKNRLAWRTSASGRDKMMTMMMTEHVPGQR